MQEFTINQLKAFAENMDELYKVFFKKYALLKPFFIKILFYNNDNYGLIITENKLVKAKFTVLKSSEGYIIESGLKGSIHLKFEVESSDVLNLINNGQEYITNAFKLFMFFTKLMHRMSILSSNVNVQLLQGKKVLLRVYENSDISYLLKWYNDYELNKLAGWSNNKVSASKLKYNMTRSFGSDPMNLMVDDLNGKPIGTIQLYDFNQQDKSCKLGIRIGDKDYWSKGYGGDAVITIVEYAFLSLDINRVDLRVYEYNERAAHCYEKCGFKFEGRTRKSAYIDGAYYDEILMGLLKSDFLKENNNQ
ncbi:MAG: GCN5-related N-acetyltransferase [Clostridia bacterium]|nr:GCN5-related N-acetyltransferase [Clostridia bacterium]